MKLSNNRQVVIFINKQADPPMDVSAPDVKKSDILALVASRSYLSLYSLFVSFLFNHSEFL